MKDINFLWREPYIDYFWATETTGKSYFTHSGFLIYEDGLLSAYATKKELEECLESTSYLVDNPSKILEIKKSFKEIKMRIKVYHELFSKIKISSISDKDLYKMYGDIAGIYREFISAYRFTEPHMVDHIENNIKKMVQKKYKKNSNKILADILSSPKNIEKYKLGKYENMFKLISEVAKVRFDAKKLTNKLSEDTEALLMETARRTNFAVNQISNMSNKEIFNILVSKREVDLYKINQRNHKFGIKVNSKKNGSVTIKDMSNAEISKIESMFNGNDDIVKGDPVYPGLVKGIARIVPKLFSDKEYTKFISSLTNKDIIIAPMTSPSLTPAFSKVRAVITDEGGLMSHAALVSREKKIPCIVGTKNATIRIKDGDRIEVDANEGIINII